MSDARFRIRADDQTASAFASAKRNLNDFSKEASSRFLGINAKSLTVVGGIAAISTGLVKATRIAETYNRENLRTEALLTATGQAAGLTAKQLEDLASATALNTLQSVQGVQRAQQVLLTFRTVQGDVFREAIGLSADLATVMGGDITSAASQLGRALEDPIAGLNALRRSGVSFSESQKEVIRNLVETGQAAEAQKIILDTLAQQLGGVAVAEAQGLSGAMDTLKQRIAEFGRELANAIDTNSRAASFFDRLARGIHNTNEALFGRQGEERLQDLRNDLMEVNKDLEKLESGEDKRRGRFRQNALDRLNEKKRGILEEMFALDKALSDERKSIRDAEEAARQAREQAQADRLQALERSEQKAGAKLAESLQRNLETEEEAYDRRRELMRQQIETLNLSEQQLRMLGYESLEQLRQDFLQRELEAHENHILAREEQEREMLAREREEKEKLIAERERNITEIEERERKRRRDLEQRHQSEISSMRTATANHSIALLQVFARENRAVAYAVLAMQKGLGAAQAIVNSQVAATRALAELGPIAGPPVAAKMVAYGRASAGLILATGLAEAAAGGRSAGSAGAPTSTPDFAGQTLPVTPIGQQQQQQGITINIHGDIRGNDAERVFSELKELINDGDHVLIESTSRNGRQIAGAS